MKILRVINSMEPTSGGPCQGIRNIIPQLSKLGISNEVVCLNNSDSEFLRSDLFVTHALGAGYSPWSYNKNLLSWLFDNISRFDVLIVHGLWLYHGFAVYKALKNFKSKNGGFGPKLYVMPHGMLDPYFQKSNKRKLKAIRNWIYWKFIEGRIINYADGILFTCQEELILAKNAFYPYQPRKEINIGYGIAEPPKFKIEFTIEFNKACPKIKNNPYILFLGRIHEKKGVDLLIEAYNYIYMQKTSEGLSIPKLLIAGPGLYSTYGKLLLKKSRNLKLENHIIFSEMLSGQAKWGAFYGCKAFILPSHQENFGIAVVEALACKKMVLISNKVNIWREIFENNAGLVFENTIEGTKDIIDKWLSMPKEDKEIYALNAHQTYLNKFATTYSAQNFITQIFS